MVAAATNNLCEAANAAVQGHASEEKLISSAKQVAASTAQLLVACKVKADHDSEAMKRLQVSPRMPLQPQMSPPSCWRCGWKWGGGSWVLPRSQAPCLRAFSRELIGTQAPRHVDFTANCVPRV